MTRRTAFVDTWAPIAWTVRTDPGHARAERLSRSVREAGGRLLTSNFVLAEALTRLRYDAGLRTALRLVEHLDELLGADVLEVVNVDQAIWAAALTWFRRFADQRFSFVDCTSFAIMADLGLTEALTSDTHFAAAGFVPLGAV